MKEKLIEFLNTRNWKYSIQDNVIAFSVSHHNGVYYCSADLRQDDLLIIFVTFSAIFCPPEKMASMINLFNKINARIVYGNFEMHDNGEFKFRSSNLFENDNMSTRIIANIVDGNLNVMDFSMQYFSQLMFGTLTVDEAFENLFPTTGAVTHQIKEIANAETNEEK